MEKYNQTTEQYLEALKEAGFRLTNQRRTIIRTLLDNIGEHPNAQELLELVQQRDPSIGIATVYRTVELLNQMDIINLSNQEEGFRRYEIADEKIHLHFYCRCCGRVIHTDAGEEKIKTIREWAEDQNFSMLPQTLEISGICENCYEEFDSNISSSDRYIACNRRCINIDPGRGRGAGRRGRNRRCLNPGSLKNK